MMGIVVVLGGDGGFWLRNVEEGLMDLGFFLEKEGFESYRKGFDGEMIDISLGFGLGSREEGGMNRLVGIGDVGAKTIRRRLGERERSIGFPVRWP